jgi:toxin ParE1/3/4
MWSAGQAEAYLNDLGETLQILLAHPGIARERPEINPPVRLHPFRSHLIVYRIEPDHLAVIRILHTRQNWLELLRT